jgi:teichuronic acid biosynthesis glycosyltransferase TuaC
MNLLFLSQVYPDASAPVRGTFNLALCRALQEEHDVRVISPRPWLDVLARRAKGRGGFHAGAMVDGPSVEYPTFWYVPRFALHRSGEWLTKSIHAAVDRVAKDVRPDAVLSYWAHPEGRAGLDAARRLGVPAACIVGGSDVLLLPKGNAKRREEIVRVLRESDAIFTVSEGLRRACLDLGAAQERVHTVYQGIDSRFFSSGDQAPARSQLGLPLDVPMFVWVGRMVPVKGLDLLLDAARRLHRTGLRFRLHLLGDGPLSGELRQLARDFSLENVVDFHGPVPQEQLGDWYRAADATLLSSRSEGLPNVLRESLACGTPFVSTDVGSVREIADPAYSLVVPHDFDTFAEAMRKVLHSDYRLAAGCYQPRTWRDCATEMAEVLVAATRGGQRSEVGGQKSEVRGRRSEIGNALLPTHYPLPTTH